MNNIKADQIHYGPTVLVVDLGRHETIQYGPSSLLHVFYHDAPPAESCVTGELWQIGLGQIGEQVFSLPEFDGASNLAGHQKRTGVLREYPELLAIIFLHPQLNGNLEVLTLWNLKPDAGPLENKCTLEEKDIGVLLNSISDGMNDSENECGWKYRVIPLRDET